MCPRLNSLTYPRCSISARRNKTARSCTSAAAINECYQSPRSAILHSQRSNPHSDRPATDRTYSSAAPPPYLPRFPPLEVFGSPARTPAYLGSHVVHGPASENLHKSGCEQVQQFGPLFDDLTLATENSTRTCSSRCASWRRTWYRPSAPIGEMSLKPRICDAVQYIGRHSKQRRR